MGIHCHCIMGGNRDMESIVLNRSELSALLREAGISRLPGAKADQTPGMDALELQQGLIRLEERSLVKVGGDGVEIDGQVGQLLSIVAEPLAIVSTFKETPEETSQAWHFISDGSIVALTSAGSGQYRLEDVANLDAVADYVARLMPLEPVPEQVQYQADVPQEDADEISAMVDNWDMVPALSLLEAGGLKMVEAKDLFDDLADYQWWGRVDLMSWESGQVKAAHRVLAVQGQEHSWVARQKNPTESTIHIETAQEGEFEAFLEQYWRELRA
jgi:hypothetical protein